jgi:hypothetical protein
MTTYAIIKGATMPEANRGRPMQDDGPLIDRAKEGRRTGHSMRLVTRTVPYMGVI